MINNIREMFGEELFYAWLNKSTLQPLTDRHPEMTIEDAYEIQKILVALRIRHGEKVIGKKIGVTSKVVQDMLNVRQPDFGFLTSQMSFPNGSVISIKQAGLIQPRAEGEIAFVLKQDLVGPNVTKEDVLDATDYVLPCFEIVDSRIQDWKIKIQDTVADNASCGIFVLGEGRIGPRDIDLAAVRMEMSRNGDVVGVGFGSAVQGHPAEAVAWLANTLGRFGIPFLAGEVILSGSLAPLVPASSGDSFSLSISDMGTANFKFEA